MGHFKTHAAIQKPCYDPSGALPGGIVKATELERNTKFRCYLSMAHKVRREPVFSGRVARTD